ncbi:hypothetical protein GCM10020227_60680 [Streptomyces flavovirens]
MWVGLVRRDGRIGVTAVFEDSGPGIPDVDQALTDGWTSGGGLGLGLSGARRHSSATSLRSGRRSQQAHPRRSDASRPGPCRAHALHPAPPAGDVVTHA